ncbi:MAG: DUF1615 family protein [Archangium sp.]|nr:DUF1615 family protein [Archangium sp.]
MALRRFLAIPLLSLMSCVAQQRAVQVPRMTVAQVTDRVPEKVPNRESWASDVLAALDDQQLPADPETVCQVLAIIEQESGFHADPQVAGLPRMLRSELEKKVEKLGPLGRPALHELLSGKAPGSKRTFEDRLPTLKTERDLDVLFRDILHFYEEKFPAPYKALDLIGALFDASPEDFNPVTTIGSMQVSVRFAEELTVKKRQKKTQREVRDSLYTQSGGVYFGTARLLGYQAAYARALYRFADYNAGLYASRNAALQEQVSQLIKQPLVLDGDLLAWDKNARPLDRQTQSLTAILAFRDQHAPELSDRRVRADVLEEKTAALESTDTWRAIKRVWAQRNGVDPPYARLPEVTIKSPKLSQDRSTAWFAKNVNARYERCLQQP